MANSTSSAKRSIRDVMTENVQVIDPGTSLREASQRMKLLDVGVLPVCQDDRLVGMVTDRDIVIKGLAEGMDPNDEIVSNVMSMPVLYCFEDQDVNEAAAVMEEKQIRRLAVLNRQKRLVGIVSLGDLAVDTRDEQLAGEVLERISEPTKQVA